MNTDTRHTAHGGIVISFLLSSPLGEKLGIRKFHFYAVIDYYF